ncbi:hypothetical protein AB32_4930 [Escherichia coli 2-316-03_S1_C2]|nr:predicted protein [Escherichia coli FVEC1302]EFJ81518.1 hypothetical protein HMPREF9534_02447 [Escherichia coli MS 69-1]EGW75039.1 hypothetical protein ECSTECC16502_0060 [Escherichia coli STEC_C165-02]ESD29960.1 hypothetical protein HMPREF1600_00927 [Escherichia coli 907715]ESD49661.1 hypothetical protein HMPREF1606_04654 [Escherichia coli 908522]ESD85682.1 hypothetical protein HMPREF1611_02511 [Escherichia coli 908573]EZJ91915.1 hypothetical protein AB72_4451 [Escherichia coli 1-250-04_S1
MLQKPSDHNASSRGKEGLSAVFVMKSRMIIFNPVNTFLSFFCKKMFIPQ